MMNSAILEDIGLTKSETNVYLALLELGSSTTGKIIDKSKTTSSKIYEILDRLMKKGLATYIIKSGVKHFESTPPERILDYVKEKEKKINKQKKDIEKILPELELKRKLSKYKSEAKIYKGHKGIETAFYEALDLLTKEDEMIVIGIPSRNEQLNRFFAKFADERAKRKIWMRATINEVAKGEEQTKYNKERLMQIKYIPQETPAAINIFKNRVLIFPETKEEPLLISIDNKEIAESFRVQFESFWNQETTVVKGVDAVQELFEEMLEAGHCDFIGARGYFMDYRSDYIKNIWILKAKKTNFTMRNITDKDVKGHLITKLPFAETKYTLEKEFANLSVFWIFGKKVVISNWAGSEPIMTIIENKQILEMYKKQFELLWNKK